MPSFDLERLEQHTQAIGREIFEKAVRSERSPFAGEHRTAKLLDWSVRHDKARLDLFRFIDVSPSLRSDADVARHLEEYFSEGPDPFGGLMRAGALAGRQPFGGLRSSGAGFKAGGHDYLLQFTEARTVTERTLRRGFADG